MRRIELKTVHVNDQPAYYGDWIRDILSVASDPRAGMTVDEMRRVLPIFTKLENDPIFALLEDSEWQTLKERVKNYKFARFTPEIIQFADYIENLPETKIKAVEDEDEEEEVAADAS